MPEKKQIYKCAGCGTIVEVIHGGVGDLICCGETMMLFIKKAADDRREKHVPVLEKITDGVKVMAGSTPHPMEEKYLEWIEIVDKNNSYCHYLNPVKRLRRSINR